jgi:Ca-activated chloride channel family protein
MQPADAASVAKAVQWVGALEADGGTEMLKALEVAAKVDDSHGNAVRQLIFITDGQVGNEAELFNFIRGNFAETRLFTVGIGSAPNSYFMSGAARMGRGTFTYIGDVNEVKEKMEALFAKIESPAVTGIEVKSASAEAEIYPAHVPDLYAGEPLVLAIRSAADAGEVTVSGIFGSTPRSSKVAPVSARQGSGVEKVWARRKIDSTLDTIAAGADRGAVELEVTNLALAHHLLTDYTSLIAVDVTPQGIAQTSCVTAPVALNDPQGQQPEGELPQSATPSTLLLLSGSLLCLSGFALRRWAA